MDTSRQASVTKPRVSVCMITYNRADFIGAAIESVQRQDYSDWELIIIDDGSVDNTKELVSQYQAKDPRIGYYKNKVNQDVSRARNRALSYARGEFVAVIDSDDVWIDNEKLGKQVWYLEKRSQVVLVGTRVVTINQDGEGMEHLKNPVSDKDIRRRMLWQNPFVHSSVMFRTRLVRQLGGYDEELITAEDYELFLRLGEYGQLANLPRYMVGYRIHGGNTISVRRGDAMKNSLLFVWRFRKKYPHFVPALLRRFIRYQIYRALLFMSPNT